MFDRAARAVCLAVAAWALLFAPGALGDVPVDEAASPVDVGAAVAAPTLDEGAIARPPARQAPHDDDVSPDEHPLPALPGAAASSLTMPLRSPSDGFAAAPTCHGPCTRRGPPSST